MVYGRRNRMRRGVRKYVRKSSSKRPTVTRIAKRVSALTRRVNRNTATQHLFQKAQELQIVDSPYVFTNLTDWTLKTPVFSTTAVDWNASNKIYHKSMKIDCRLSFGNERDLIGYRAFLVSLKDDMNVPAVWNSGTGGLALTSNLEYSQGSFGLGRLNPKSFHIHKVKTFFTFGPNSGASGTGNAGNRLIHQWSWSIKPNHTVYNPRGNVSAMVTSQDPSKCYYIIIMTDNVAGDLESPVFSCAVNHTITVAQ